MMYSVTLFTPVATPYGIAIERWEFPRLPADEAAATIQTADALGWDHLISVSLTKDREVFAVKEDTLPAEYTICECDCCNARFDAEFDQMVAGEADEAYYQANLGDASEAEFLAWLEEDES